MIDFRAAGVGYDRLAGFAAELVRLNVDVILATEGSAAARAAKDVTRTMPVIMVDLPDAVVPVTALLE